MSQQDLFDFGLDTNSEVATLNRTHILKYF